jgi:hypothetical protein
MISFILLRDKWIIITFQYVNHVVDNLIKINDI